MSIIAPEVLLESKSARSNQLETVSSEKAIGILNKVKALYFAAWKNESIVTTEQLAEFFEVSTDAVLVVEKRHRDEFELDGSDVLRGKALKYVTDKLSVATRARQLRIWTAKAALRMGLLLRDSEVARTVRDMMIHLVTDVVPTLVDENLRLQVELAKHQAELARYQAEAAREQRMLMERRETVTILHQPHQAALILGANVVQMPPEIVEKTVTVDSSGRRLSTFDGVGINYLTKRFGFKDNKKTWDWLESIGYGKGSKRWVHELTAVPAPKLPREHLDELNAYWKQGSGVRQLMIGEGF